MTFPISWFRNSQVSFIDGQWHHICVTWDNTAGQTAVYQDGVQRSQGILKKGHVIKGGGSLIIGQDQDTLGGGFQAHQSYVGELTEINMWDRVLGPSEISAMATKRKSTTFGNVFSWNDVISSSKYGEVQIIRSCNP